MKKSINYIKKNQVRFQKEYFDFLRIPSVSADPVYKKMCLKPLSFLKQELQRIGLDKVKVAYPKKIKNESIKKNKNLT